MKPRNTYRDTYRGPWADDADAAIRAVFADVNIDPADWGVMLTYGDDSFALDPHDPTLARIIGEVYYSEARLQYRAIIRR